MTLSPGVWQWQPWGPGFTFVLVRGALSLHIAIPLMKTRSPPPPPWWGRPSSAPVLLLDWVGQETEPQIKNLPSLFDAVYVSWMQLPRGHFRVSLGAQVNQLGALWLSK